MYEAAASCKDDIAREPRNILGTAFCNAYMILLRHEARDESWDRNTVTCESFATLRRYGTRKRYNCGPTLRRQYGVSKPAGAGYAKECRTVQLSLRYVGHARSHDTAVHPVGTVHSTAGNSGAVWKTNSYRHSAVMSGIDM